MGGQATVSCKYSIKSMKRVYNLCYLDENLKFGKKRKSLTFFVNQLAQTLVIFLNDMKGSFAVYENSLWK